MLAVQHELAGDRADPRIGEVAHQAAHRVARESLARVGEHQNLVAGGGDGRVQRAGLAGLRDLQEAPGLALELVLLALEVLLGAREQARHALLLVDGVLLAERGLEQISDEDELRSIVARVVAENPEVVEKVRAALGTENYDYRRVEVVGPRVSSELARTGTLAVLFTIAGIMAYIWFRFEWQFAVAAIASLAHDVVGTIGLFALLQLEFNLSTVAAILGVAAGWFGLGAGRQCGLAIALIERTVREPDDRTRGADGDVPGCQG